MKQSSVAFAIIFTAITSGCQDNQLLGPESSDPAGVQKAAEVPCSTCPGSIQLAGTIPLDPIDLGSEEVVQEGTIWGEVEYVITPAPIFSRDYVDLKLGLDAFVQPGYRTDPVWIFEGGSEDRISIPSNNQPASIEKEYFASNVDGPYVVTLHISYSVSRTVLSVSRMWVTTSFAPTSASVTHE